MTFFPLRPASAPIATPREHYHSAGAATVNFWASSLRSALVSHNGARADPAARLLARSIGTAPDDTANEVEFERWDLLSALDESWEGPPTAVQLTLLDHLAPPDVPRLTH